MANLVISNLDTEMLERLNARAAIHGRSLEGEVKTILEEAATEIKPDAWAVANMLRQDFAESGRQFGDSAELIREDRGR